MDTIIRTKMKTGDIIITETDLPLIEHFGVIVIEDGVICVFHCTPSKNVRIDTLNDFLENREFKYLRHTKATRAGICERYQKAKDREYDAINFNCIHFAEFLTE